MDRTYDELMASLKKRKRYLEDVVISASGELTDIKLLLARMKANKNYENVFIKENTLVSANSDVCRNKA